MVYRGGDKIFLLKKWETIQLTAIVLGVLDMAGRRGVYRNARTASGKLFVAIFSLTSLLNTIDDGPSMVKRGDAQSEGSSSF